MKIVIAPDSFKESASASEIAAAMLRGVLAACPQAETILIPMADGGEGFAVAFMNVLGGLWRHVTVCGPLGEAVEAGYALVGNGRTAVIDMASCCGLALLPPEKRNPLHTTTYGVGQLLLDAADNGAQEIILGLGGSATVDGACGMVQAAGVAFFDSVGKIETPICGGMLSQLQCIDSGALDERLRKIRIRAACDVTNPLLGPHGAARVFGPQKGADAPTVEKLENGLAHLSELLPHAAKDFPGAGAAGGAGFGVKAFFDAGTERGAELLMDACCFNDRLAGADLLITGEGRIDSQTAGGKTCHAVAGRAKLHNVPVLALAGSLGSGIENLNDVFTAVFSICDGPMSLSDAMRSVLELTEKQTCNAVSCFLAGKNARR